MQHYGNLSQEVLAIAARTPARQPQRSDRQVHHKLRLNSSDLPGLPAGSVVDVLNVGHGSFEFGDLVCGMQGKQTFIGRFLGLKGEDIELSVGNRVHRMKPADSIGKVTRAEVDGKDFDPARQSALGRFISRLTRYGTLFR